MIRVITKRTIEIDCAEMKAKRTARGLTFEDLGKMVGSCAANLCNIERGKRRGSEDLIRRIVRVLEMP